MNVTLKSFILSCILIFTGYGILAQSVVGKWKTIDDNTGKTRSIVEIYIKDGKLYGKVLKTFPEPGEDPNPKCTECDDDDHRKNKPVIGMVIITGLEKDGDEWEGDDAILDPENGEVYDCEIWLDEDNPDRLKVRGYIAFFFRTQTWHRVK